MAASEKQRSEKIITVASRPAINCQQLQDLSTSTDADPPLMDSDTDSNTNTHINTNTNTDLNTKHGLRQIALYCVVLHDKV